jgi:hypothetical protein
MNWLLDLILSNACFSPLLFLKNDSGLGPSTYPHPVELKQAIHQEAAWLQREKSGLFNPFLLIT